MRNIYLHSENAGLYVKSHNMENNDPVGDQRAVWVLYQLRV